MKKRGEAEVAAGHEAETYKNALVDSLANSETQPLFLLRKKEMQIIASFFLAAGLLLSVTNADSVPWERLNKNDSLLLILDLQVGLYSLARDFDPTLYYNAMLAHSALGNLFVSPFSWLVLQTLTLVHPGPSCDYDDVRAGRA